MKVLVIYDSQYGNTEQVAKAISGAFGAEGKAVKIGEVKREEIKDYDLIFIGSPTQGGRHSLGMKAFLDNLPKEVLAGKRLAAFDTRLKTVFVKMFGYAAPRIESAIKAMGGNSTAQPQGFFVKSAKGPVLDGELERAAAWAKAAAAGVPTNLMSGFEDKQKG